MTTNQTFTWSLYQNYSKHVLEMTEEHSADKVPSTRVNGILKFWPKLDAQRDCKFF